MSDPSTVPERQNVTLIFPNGAITVSIATPEDFDPQNVNTGELILSAAEVLADDFRSPWKIQALVTDAKLNDETLEF